MMNSHKPLKTLLFVLATLVVSSCSVNHSRTVYKPDYGRNTAAAGGSESSGKNPPPSTHNNICKIYAYDKQWQTAAKASAQKWGTPEHTLMAIINQESKFVKHARPSYRGAATSSSYGYSQAQEMTWKEYQKAINNPRAKRTDIKDSLDFIGWYNNNTNKRNRVNKTDTKNLYLAYHEGNGGFARKTYQQKPWLLKVANKVEHLALDYKSQLKNCSR